MLRAERKRGMSASITMQGIPGNLMQHSLYMVTESKPSMMQHRVIFWYLAGNEAFGLTKGVKS
jgi:hypothetical protein